MKKSTLFFLGAAFAIGLAAAVIFLQKPQVTPPIQAPPPKEQTSSSEHQPVMPPGPERTAVQNPEKLPELGASDTVLQKELSALLPQKTGLDMVIFDHLIRRFVLMVDSLPRPAISYRRLPFHTPADRFIPREENDVLTISPENYQRYKPFVNLVDQVPVEGAAEIYFHYYPLFQKAYRELGYPEGHFHERLIETIDHLLATPEVQEPIRLVQPHIRYQYADPELEALSAGKKLLIRMGGENAAVVFGKLRALRSLLIDFTPGGM
jgi:hypothetical protein